MAPSSAGRRRIVDVAQLEWCDPGEVDLRQFYDRIEVLIVSLQVSRHAQASAAVESALRGGATSGEILGRLGLTLPEARAAAPERALEIDELEAFIRHSLP